MSFDTIFPFIIKWEGSEYEDDPADPGGATKFGIDTKDDRDWWKHYVDDLHKLTLDQAKEIYRQKYWLGSDCDLLPSPIAEVHFNYSVNTGKYRSFKFLQSALAVPADGKWGPVTHAAVLNCNAEDTALKMIDNADAFYKSLGGKFVAGWLNRNAALREFLG